MDFLCFSSKKVYWLVKEGNPKDIKIIMKYKRDFYVI